MRTYISGLCGLYLNDTVDQFFSFGVAMSGDEVNQSLKYCHVMLSRYLGPTNSYVEILMFWKD